MNVDEEAASSAVSRSRLRFLVDGTSPSLLPYSYSIFTFREFLIDIRARNLLLNSFATCQL
jgi:hypothetical protein